MSVLSETPSRPQSPEASSQVELAPKLTARFAFGWQHVLATAFLAAFYLYLSYIPLFHTDIWGHVHYGHWILEQGQLPQEDPFMPLAEGMRVVDNAWLTQLIFGVVERVGGAETMSMLFAVVVFATYLIYTRVFYLLTGQLSMALAGFMLLFFLGFSRHAIIRPEIFGGLCFALLWWIVIRLAPWKNRVTGEADDAFDADSRWPLWIWIATPLLFLFWANGHGSFAVGLVALGCHVAGSAIDTAWRERSLLAPLHAPIVRRWTCLFELSLLATLLNPYGIDLLIETARFGQNPNLRDVLEWFPLTLIDLEGIQFCVSLVLLVFVLRHSRIPMSATSVLLLLVYAMVTAPTVRMISWYAVAFSVVMVPHIDDVWRRIRRQPSRMLESAKRDETSGSELDDEELSPTQFVPSFVCLLIIWTAFSFSPLSRPVLGGLDRQPEQLYSKMTPLHLTEYLDQHPPEGLVFAPQWWGDWLSLHGPENIQVFMTTNVHLVPRQVWRDYLRVARGLTGWDRVLERYHVNTLVVHKELQENLARVARQSSDWSIVYEDDLGLVLEREGVL